MLVSLVALWIAVLVSVQSRAYLQISVMQSRCLVIICALTASLHTFSLCPEPVKQFVLEGRKQRLIPLSLCINFSRNSLTIVDVFLL